MSSEPQQVSAALVSAVNPGGAGAAKGMAEALGGGWLELWYQPKIAAEHSSCRVRKRLSACAIRNWESSSQPVSYPEWGRGFCRRYRNLSSPGRLPIGATF